MLLLFTTLPLTAATPRNLQQVLSAARDRPELARVLSEHQRFEVQIRWTRVLKDGPRWRTHTQTFGVKSDRWFAAASMVKLPLAVMALEALAQRKLPLDSHLQASMPEGCTPALAHADTPPLAEPLSRTLHRLLVVSDNEAFNRLYQWLGPPLPQQRFRRMGFTSAHITRPLMVCDDAARARLGDWAISTPSGAVALRGPAREATDRPVFNPPSAAMRGKAWTEAGVLQPGPHDFSDSNYLPLALLERELMSVVRPELLAPAQRSSMRETDRRWLREQLSSTPPASTDPRYPVETFPAYFAKFLLVGDGRTWPDGVRIYNKVGESYGYLSDVAYIEDSRHGFGFFLSAVVFVDLDGTLNDGNYAYKELGRPYLAALGQLILEEERRLRGVAVR